MQYIILLGVAVLLLGLMPERAHAETEAPKPLVGIYVTPQDIETAKNNIAHHHWAKAEWERIKKIADYWLTRDDDWIRSVMPAKGSTFAYGVNGCPACGGSWKSFGKNTCSWEKPGKVICPQCGREFPDPDPNSPYHDTGKGIVVNGKPFFPVGVWNSWVVDQMSSAFDPTNAALDNLGYAYALTGDARYAHKAAVIMDALATLSPTTIGPRDFEQSHTSLEGRCHYLTSIVYRVRMRQIDTYDLIGRLPDLEQPSPSNPGLSMRQNIEKNLLEDYLFLHFDVRNGNLSTLHNHEADSLRAMLGVGLVTANPDFVRWGLEGIFYFIDNTVDRDGQYYETSMSYSGFSATVLCDMAELAANYSPNDYPDPSKFPNPADYPYGLNFFNHPKLAITCLRSDLDLNCAGHEPGFGNGHVDLSTVLDESEALSGGQWSMAERFFAKSTDPGIRRLALSRMLRTGDPESRRNGTWCLFHAQSLPKIAPDTNLPEESSLLGGRVAGVLRSGVGANRRAVFMRGGCTLPHGHDDLLGLLLFAKGRDLSYEIGYGIYGTHVNVGWSVRQASHNLVIVDEDMTRPEGYFRASPGAKTLFFGGEGPVRMMEMDGLASRASDKLTMYRRALAQVDLSPEDSYVVDIFRVAGGSRHDYLLHAPYGSDEANDFRTEGISLEKPEAWTVAGLNPANRGASYDKLGWSWGERITQGEVLKQMGDPSEKIGGNYWLAPPRNGYGFLHNVQIGRAEAPFAAEWYGLAPGDTRLRMLALPQPGTETITAEGPSLDGKHRLHHVILRRSGEAGLQSRFVSVLIPYQGSCPVTKVEEIELHPANPMAVCVKVTRADGRVDYVLSAPGNDERLIAVDGNVRIAFQGRFAVVRVNAEKVENKYLLDGTELTAIGKTLSLPKAEIEAKIASVEGSEKLIVLDHPVWDGMNLAGRVALIQTEGSPRNAAYTIRESFAKEGKLALKLESLDFVLARGVVQKVEGKLITSKVPVPYASVHEKPTHYFDQSPVRNLRTGEICRTNGFRDLKSFEVSDPEKWKVGDAFELLDFVPGDQVAIPLSAQE